MIEKTLVFCGRVGLLLAAGIYGLIEFGVFVWIMDKLF